MERLDDPRRARRARGGGLPDPPPHLGRPGADRRRLPLLRRRAARPQDRLPLPRRASSASRGCAARSTRRSGRRPAPLSRITDLVALVTAPPLATATIHRVEVLRLQPRVVMVVVIASNGASRSASSPSTRRSTRPGRVGGELPERAARRARAGGADGRRPAARPRAGRQERGFIAEISSAFTDLDEPAEDTLYVDGAARLLSRSTSPTCRTPTS